MPKPLHYQGSYHVRSRHVRQVAYANPRTRCWRCNRTLRQHEPHKDGKPARWQAGHVIDGKPDGPLAPEASTCNTKAGARLGNSLRRRTDLSW